ATDTEIELSTNEASEARVAKVTKQRDYQGGEEFIFKLDPVSLGQDQDGDTVSTCVVVPLDERPKDDFLPPRATCKAILKAIDEAWQEKNPFTAVKQKRSIERFAERVLSQRFDLPAVSVQRLITSWIDSGVVAHEVVDSNT